MTVARASCELGLLPGSVVVTTLSGGLDWGLRGLSRSPEGVGLFPGVVALSALVGGMARA